MSERESILQLLDSVPEEKFGDVLIYLRSLIPEETDDEKIDRAAKEILKKYHHAFEVLAQ